MMRSDPLRSFLRSWLDRREASLESPALASGWHAPEPGWRWTGGDAELLMIGVRELAFGLAMTGTCWLDAERRDVRVAWASQRLQLRDAVLGQRDTDGYDSLTA